MNNKKSKINIKKNNIQLNDVKEAEKTQNNKGIIIHGINKLHDNCFNLPCIFIRFHERNIKLKINRKRSFGTTYTYSGFFDNYNIGLNSKKIINKKYKKFNLNIFFYFNKKDNHLYVSSE